MSLHPGNLIRIFFLLLIPAGLYAQGTGQVSGSISDSTHNAIFLANISVRGTGTGTVTARDGSYTLEVPANQDVILVFSCVGYQSVTRKMTLTPGEKVRMDLVMSVSMGNIGEVSILEDAERSTTLSRIDIRTIESLPASGGAVEALLKTLPGVSSGNELSSQYSVRGGNFDENLVYVNDVEIYRPFLIRSGQQEGLSFIDSRMVSSVMFSAGGFEARYGDKMSSVLDITYKRPVEFAGSVDMSLLGGAVHLEDAPGKGRITFITGFRYKTSRYLLSSLETKGEYIPNFLDFQTFVTCRLGDKTDLNFLGNIAGNAYGFIPETRSTDFGTVQNPYNLVIYYDGREKDRFDTYQGAVILHYRPTDNLSLKLIQSGFGSIESENFDIQGQYLINELDNRPGSETYGDSILNIGIGTFLNHARNRLNATVYSASHIGTWFSGNLQLKWGARYRHEYIRDHIREWELIDSAGYSIPYSRDQVLLSSLTRSDNLIISNRMSGFVQTTYNYEGVHAEYFIIGGLRASYWDYNGQLLVSPRASLSAKPSANRNVMFRVAAGAYDQPPFYKELRYPDGSINPNVRAQKSIHLVMGADYHFKSWDRPFVLSSEIYFKYLYELIPYRLDIVRIEYAAENLARGYATGIEFKINGEFVKDAESWASLSIMKTAEDIEGDYYYDQDGKRIEPGYYPRPTDRLINFGMFFQDYFPNNPDYKVNLNFLYGGRLPFSPPGQERYDLIYRMPAYKRVDIGFSKMVVGKGRIAGDKQPLKFLRSVWITGEIFNLLGVNNTISYLWVKTVSNQDNIPGQFAVPNYLTSRRFNLRVITRF